ncbi:BTB/POZ domain-containing protein 2-like [Lutzomyia longipalpis]|uniref:BTB/POZ domain-containing protein 2-like n=1 Tax=Lutzomyia longipalpis TaxID=7200 RepID=UPI0024840334|nr:BTB/POZ domain-containing protein 2-like [Lutzomyia longipalpis]XP_055693620.1 BTB/POZ domain-containing protein 2-like [Lutzomyia longipalpis]
MTFLGNWQKTTKSLSERYAHLLGKDLMADMVFLVGANEVRIPGHRLVLAVNSHDFYNALYRLRPDRMELRIEDVSVGVFMRFLEYCYTGHVNMEMDKVFDVLKLAMRYEMRHLEGVCVNFVARHLKTANCLRFLNKSWNLNCLRLIHKCQEHLAENFCDVLSNNRLAIDFPELPHGAVKWIVELETLQCDEKSLFDAVMLWARRECTRNGMGMTPQNMRTALGDILYQIRFPTMTNQEFSECTRKYPELLSADEMTKITVFSNVPAAKVRFNKNPRLEATFTSLYIDNGIQEVATIRRITKGHRVYDDHNRHGIRLTSSRRINIYGFGIIAKEGKSIYGKCSVWDAEFCFQFPDLKPDIRRKLWENYEIIYVIFKNPLTLESSTPYELSFFNCANVCCVNEIVRETVRKEEITFHFEKFQDFAAIPALLYRILA